MELSINFSVSQQTRERVVFVAVVAAEKAVLRNHSGIWDPVCMEPQVRLCTLLNASIAKILFTM